MIYKIQPFATDKSRFGEEINNHCSMVPGNEWILLLDYDCMILTPETYHVIEKAIENNPNVTMFGAMTNRVGLSFQRYNNIMSDNDSLKYHLQIAKAEAARFPNGESKTVPYIAGFFMLFKRTYWLKHPFQEKIMNKRGNLFDYEFCKPLRNQKGSVKVIQGAYVLHKYRIEQEDYKVKEHLID